MGLFRQNVRRRVQALHRTRMRIKYPMHIICCALLLFTVGCQRRAMPRAQHFTDFALGTVITVTFYDGTRANNERISTRLFEYAHSIETRMSTSQADYDNSELLLLNATADSSPTTVSTELMEIIDTGVQLSRITDGTFQIGIWPLTKLWDFSLLRSAEQSDTAELLLPDTEDVNAALPLARHDGIFLDYENSTVMFAEEGMGVDVSGIAKGWVGTWFREQLKDIGVERALIDIGGNIVTVGDGPTEDRGWQIGIQDPTAPQGAIVGVLSIGERAVVTSGDYERFVMVDDNRYHHIIDPFTGYPVTNQLSSVTIVAPNSTVADAFSTAVYVKGLVHGRDFVEQQTDVEALFITKDKTIIVTDGLRDAFSVRSDMFTLVQ